MSAAVSRSSHQRAEGLLRLDLHSRDGITAIADLRQEGCLKARFPRPAGWTEAITLNTSGGMAGGDRLASEIRVRNGASATIAAQAAERCYRALPDDAPAHVRTVITVDARASVEWLPQETILFDGCALDRMLTLDIAEDGWFLGVEALVFGRAAMGERVRQARIVDTIRVRRDGRVLLHDAIRLRGEVAATLGRPAVSHGGTAVATIVHVATDAMSRLDELRSALAEAPAETGASAWAGMLVARIVARDGADLRVAVVAGLTCLRAGRPLPRVWQF